MGHDVSDEVMNS